MIKAKILKAKIGKTLLDITYGLYLWLWVRPQQLVKLIIHPEYYTSPSYYPEYSGRRRSHCSQFWNQVGEILRYGRINTFYYCYGFDISTAKEQKEFVHYNTFMRRREELNRTDEDNCACILRDKLYFAIFTQGIGLKGSDTMFFTLNGNLYDFRTKAKTTVDAILALGDTKLFCKPLDGQCGNGIFVLQVKDGRMKIHEKVDENGTMVAKEIEVDAVGLKRHCSSGRYLFQRFIIQHPAMNSLHPQSVNTIRMTTVRSPKDGQAHALLASLRVGTGDSIVDNFAQGGLVVKVNMETGYLERYGIYKPMYGRKTGDGTTVFKEEEHPDSHIVFAEFKIPYFHEAVQQAEYYHSMLPSLHSIGWDIAIGEDGPIFVEGNDNWEITLHQTYKGGLRKEFDEYFCL